ncbi:hypothetical protein DFH11DRAFT_273975 [Phellopilus nigrolimitatus]|nr:hypothetical protein DFH11DRAFT_273975 [Phellopilus nigrolimitatus]
MNDACSQHQPSRRRSNSTGRQSGFQVRANNLVRKLGMLTSKLSGNARSKISDSDSKVKEPDTYPYREARSMDLMRTKPFMSSPMLAINFQSQSLGRRSVEEESTQSHSNESGDATMPSSDAVAAAAQGLAAAAIAAEASLRPSPEIQEQTRSPTQVEGLPPGGLASPELTTQSNSPQAPTQMRSQRPEPPLDTESIHQKSSSNNNDSAPSSSKRPAVPRLNTLPPLPPLSLSLKGTTQDQRLSRLSPSVIVRPPPFPILDLPAVRTPIAEHPTVSPSHMHARKAVRLNSMPMLPMEGRDERENDPEHEHYGLDEDEEGDEDAEGDEENTDAHMESDDDEDEIAGRSSLSSPSSSPSNGSGFLARTRGLSLRLPELLPTSNLSAMLGSVGVEAGSSSAGAGHARPSGLTPANADFARMQRDDVATPKAANWGRKWKRKKGLFLFPFRPGCFC